MGIVDISVDRLFDVYYKDNQNKEHKVRYCCKDKSQAERLFYSECRKDEVISRVLEVKE